MKDWREKYASGRKGICDFGLNYDFYFKWLLNKVISCFSIHGLPDTVNETYTKAHLILDGNVCYTDFPEGQFVCIGSWGGYPDEYYIPTTYVIANPVLGSKTVYLKESDEHSKTGVVITNTAIDGIGVGIFSGGLYDLIHQTATLLADNIISINCCQINSRVATFFTADSEAQAVAGENVLKKMYAGSPYQVFRQDLLEKININPVANSSSSQTVTQLVELHNYIVANFFQSVGIKSNNVMKRERLISDEINTQDDFVQLSVLEILSSWQKGFDEVNRLYGTEITVELNPVLVREIADEFMDDVPEHIVENQETEITENVENQETETVEDNVEDNVEEPEQESPSEVIEEAQEIVAEIVDIINDETTEPEVGEEDGRNQES